MGWAIKRMIIAILVFVSCTKAQEPESVVNAGTPDSPEPPASTEINGKALVAFYSFTNNCRAIATELGKQVNCDIVEIQPEEGRLDYAANSYAIGSALISAIRNNPTMASSYPAIKAVDIDCADYDNIIIVTPLWWSQMAAPMQTFLFHNGAKMTGKNVGLIASSASSGISGLVADLKRLVPDGKFMNDNLWIKSSEVNKASPMISSWLASIGFANKPSSRCHHAKALKT